MEMINGCLVILISVRHEDVLRSQISVIPVDCNMYGLHQQKPNVSANEILPKHTVRGYNTVQKY